MLEQASYFLGVNIHNERLPFTFALIDDKLKVKALEQGHMEEVLAFASGDRLSMVGINAPPHVNCGLMQKVDIRQNLSPPPADGRWVNARVVEYQLHCKGDHITRTPGIAGECPEWMRLGFSLYEHLQEIGFSPYSKEGATRQWGEVPAESAYRCILGVVPQNASSLEGRIQRQLALVEQGVKIQDPMETFEEVTRFRLLHGNFPFSKVLNPKELNALVAAMVVWMAKTKPDRIIFLGHEEESRILLPGEKIR
jgi:hypothetical protein